MVDTGARARAVVRLLERTQVGVALLVLLAGALFAGGAIDPAANDPLLGPLLPILLGGGVVLAGLDILDGPVRFWGFADSDLPITGGRVVTWALRLLELGVAVILGLALAGIELLSTIQASPPDGGILLAGLSGVHLLSVLIGLLIVLRVGLAAISMQLE